MIIRYFDDISKKSEQHRMMELILIKYLKSRGLYSDL